MSIGPGRSGHLRTPFSALAKPTGALCNLACAYCYYLPKGRLYDDDQAMSDDVLAAYLSNLLDSQPDGRVEISWQGGEPTLRGLDFFRRAVALARQLRRPAQRLAHVIQTNGTLLDDEWGEFLAEHGFLVGLSLDGPAELHDAYRVNKAGRGSHAQAVRGWWVLQRHGVETNILCAVHEANQARPLDVYRYLRDELGARYLQFIPIVERDAATSRGVAPEAWGRFLTTIFDEWVARDVGRVFVQHFDGMLGNLFGRYSVCVHAPRCGTAVVVEHTGDVYSCDHFVEPGHLLGNVMTTPLSELVTSEFQRRFGADKLDGLPGMCLACPVRWACHGGCPKDRFLTTPGGEPGLNYLCAGYLGFFTHATPAIQAIARLLEDGREAADVMA